MILHRLLVPFILSPLFLFGMAEDLSDAALGEVETHLRFIASDELAGRKAGTLGNRVAARYIAEQFRFSDVHIASGMQSYFQPVGLERMTPPEHGTIRVGETRLLAGRDFVALGESPIHGSFRWVRLGHDPQASEQGIENVDAQGKVVLTEFGAGLRSRRSAAEALGAVAVVAVYDGDNWERVRRRLSIPRVRLHDPAAQEISSVPYFVIDKEPLGEDTSLGATLALDVGVGSRERFESDNVVGVIPGRDETVADEFLVLMAHYDHVGASLSLPGATQEDHIFNGARDNGMGVVALIWAAQSLGARPPRRSVVVLATTAEEDGLLGSNYYVNHPVVSLRRTVFALNLDGAGFDSTDAVTVLGLDRTTAGPQIREACARFGLEALPGADQLQSFFERSDNVRFARAGVPAPTYSPVMRSQKGDAFRYYHTPQDEAGDDFDFAYLLRFSQAFAAVARAIADSPERPRWVDGDPFQKLGKALYNGSE